MAEATTLVKYLAAHSGYSRRKATDLIKEGKVTVNSSVVAEPWHEIKQGDDVRVEGKRVKEGGKVYFLLNKPEGYITTMEDDLGRADVSLLMKGATKERIFPIGRLDKDTTGLLVFTNDGALAQRLSHPRFKMDKEYQVTLDKPVNPEHLKLMFKGVFLPDGNARVDRAALMPGKRKYVVIVEIHSGKKHIIRRLFRHFGYEVRALDRISYAGLSKKGLPVGKWRALTPGEVESLQTLAAKAAAKAPKPGVGKKKRIGGARTRSSRFGDEKRSSYKSRGERVERPDLRRKNELSTTRSHGDHEERASWREQRESSFDIESWFNEGEDEQPRSRSKPTPTRSKSQSRSKPKSMVRTKPAHKRTKPGGGGKSKSRTGTKKRK